MKNKKELTIRKEFLTSLVVLAFVVGVLYGIVIAYYFLPHFLIQMPDNATYTLEIGENFANLIKYMKT
jgi:hypothetical protein